MIQLSDTQRSLVALVAIRNAVEKVTFTFFDPNSTGVSERPDRFSDANLCFSTQNYLQILLSSFLEEWGHFSSFAKDDLYLRDTLRQVTPAMDQFKGWKDLRSVRSKLLAHPFSDRHGNLLFPWDVFRENDSPTTLAETLLLGFCVLFVVDRVKTRHSEDVNDADEQLLKLDRSVPEKGISTMKELVTEFNRIQTALNETADKRA